MAKEQAYVLAPMKFSLQRYQKGTTVLFGKKHTKQRQSHGSNNKYGHTVFLPKSKFPIMHKPDSRIRLDNEIAEKCRPDSLYRWQLERDLPSHEFGGNYVIHDGPPYANGPAHVGHALNKILKDITLRFKVMTGHRVHLRPGWDCHGLPIELQVAPPGKSAFLTPSQVREEARKFAKSKINLQRNSFQSFAAVADWNNFYSTLDIGYQKQQLRIFWNLFSRGLIYRGFLPTYWSPSSQTALAEAEIEYKPHVSTSAFVKFPLCQSSHKFLLIWTTTPWTLPANDAVAVHPDETYCWVRDKTGMELWLVSQTALQSLREKFSLSESLVDSRVSGADLRGLAYTCPPALESPHLPKKRVVIASRNIEASKGTGLAHIASAHGFEDFRLVKEALGDVSGIQCFVNYDARFTDQIVSHQLANLSIFDEGTSQLLELIKDYVIKVEDYSHSYPYDWRTGKPVVILPSEQWFFDIEKLKPRILEQLEKWVKFYPTHALKNMTYQVSRRPHWCISRQRTWGLPIPVFYDEAKEPVVSEEIVEHLIDKCDKHVGIHQSFCSSLVESYKQGSFDFWWELPEKDMLPAKLANLNLRKGHDIFDIWFDSGVSWSAACSEHNRELPIDCVIEGHDQFRGWFASLAFTALGIGKEIPYKTILSHGFVLDDKGRKMSKSLGNVISPQEILQGSANSTLPVLGVDGLRFWAAKFGTSGSSNVFMGESVLRGVEENLKDVRNVLRYILGSIRGANSELLEVNNFMEDFATLDIWMLQKTRALLDTQRSLFESFQYSEVVSNILNFVKSELSAGYIFAIKDRLYCDSLTSYRRLACLSVLNYVGNALTTILAPIVPHLVEEYCHHHFDMKIGDGFKRGWNTVEPLNVPGNEVATAFDVTVIPLRKEFLAKYSSNPGLDRLSVSLNISDNGALHGQHIRLLEGINKDFVGLELRDILGVSEVKVSLYPFNANDPDDTWIVIDAKPSEKGYCARCRKCVIDTTQEDSSDLCHRCSEIVHFSGANPP